MTGHAKPRRHQGRPAQDKPSRHAGRHNHHPYRWVVTLVVLGLLAYVLAPQLPTLRRSLAILPQADWLFVAAAIAITGLTYILSAGVYRLLVKHPVSFLVLVQVQVATALVGRIAPIGVGTMGFNAYFLKRNGHTTGESLAVVGANNGLGAIGHVMLLGLVLALTPLPFSEDISVSASVLYWVLAVSGLIAVTLAASRKLRTIFTRVVGDLLKTLRSYRHRRTDILLALATSLTLSCVYVLCLVACARALGVQPGLGQIFLVYTFSLLTGAATPTPGGLVGVEAGITAGLTSYGIATEQALAIALLFRLVTYWLPLLPGLIAFRHIHHRHL